MVAGQHDHFDTEFMESGDRFFRGWLDAVRNADHSDQFVVVRGKNHGVAAGGVHGADVDFMRLHERHVAEDEFLSVNPAENPVSGQRFEIIDFGKRQVALLCGADNRIRQWMFRILFGGGRHCKKLVFSERRIFSEDDAGKIGTPFRNGSGFVENHGRCLAGGFQRFPALDENAQLCAAPDSDDQRNGSRQTERAGTRDHQYCKSETQRMGECLPDSEEPDGECRRRDEDDAPDEEAGDGVRQTCDRRTGPLCVLNHGDDFGYDRVVACMCYAEDERTVSVHGAAGYAGTGGFFHGHAFAGQHGFVNGRGAFLHDAVRRDPLSGFDADTVIGFELVYRNDDLSVIHHQVSGFRCELHQFADGSRRLAAGTCFQKLAEHDQCNDHASRIEIEMNAVAFRHQVDTVNDRRAGSERDERIHIR